jgi:predicted amidophosphoribosyltransferase
VILGSRKTRERERLRRELRRRLYLELAEPARCLDCRTELEPHYRCCPGCGTQLLRECESCGRSVHAAWSACAHCGDGAQPQLVPDVTASGAEA